MKKFFFCFAVLSMMTMFACKNDNENHVVEYTTVHDTFCDTINTSPPLSFTFNLPCKMVYFNADKPGKARLVVLLHGGVSDKGYHSLLGKHSHLDYVRNDEIICDYLKKSGKKSIFLAPICHKAELDHCVKWHNCANDVKRMIDDLVNAGQVDESQIYLTGGSDGGVGTWELAKRFPNLFAAIMPMSCGLSYELDVPVYWHSTKSEGDFTRRANSLNSKGANIHYRYHGDVGHGIDCNRIDKALLDEFFSNRIVIH